MSLTSAAVKAARPRSCAYKMADERGLFLFVAPTGLKSFRWKFRFGGKEQLLVLGRFPEISLTEARAMRDAARLQLDRGEDPRGGADAAPDLDTFEATARAWRMRRRARSRPPTIDRSSCSAGAGCSTAGRSCFAAKTPDQPGVNPNFTRD
jgi:hypothetical protein